MKLVKMKWSLILFSINFFITIDIFMLRNNLDKMVNWYILPHLWVIFVWMNLTDVL